MEFALILRELAARRRMVAIGVAVAAVVALFSVYRVDGFGLKPRALVHSSASTQVLVDSDSSVLGNVSQSFEPLASRAAVYANFMTSPTVLNLIAQRVGLSGDQLYAAGPVSLNEPRVEEEPTALKRNVEITGETKPYRLTFESQASLPTITINTQAPTTQKAVALANAAVTGMQATVLNSETANSVPPSERVIIRQLGPAVGGVDDSGIRKSLAAMVFLAILVLWCIGMLVVPRLRDAWRRSASMTGIADEGAADEDHPVGASRNGHHPVVAAESSNGGHPVVVDERSNGDHADVPALDIQTVDSEGAPFDVSPYGGDGDRPAVPARSTQ